MWWSCERIGSDGAFYFSGEVERSWSAYADLLASVPDWCVDPLREALNAHQP